MGFACAMCGNQSSQAGVLGPVQLCMLALPFVVLALGALAFALEIRKGS